MPDESTRNNDGDGVDDRNGEGSAAASNSLEDCAFTIRRGKPSNFTVSTKRAASARGGLTRAKHMGSSATPVMKRPRMITDAVQGDLVSAINQFTSQVCGVLGCIGTVYCYVAYRSMDSKSATTVSVELYYHTLCIDKLCTLTLYHRLLCQRRLPKKQAEPCAFCQERKAQAM